MSGAGAHHYKERQSVNDVAGVVPEDPANPLAWANRIDADVVTRLPYGFCKRQGVVAVASDANGVQVVCVEKPPLDVFGEIRRQVDAPIRLHQMPQAGLIIFSG